VLELLAHATLTPRQPHSPSAMSVLFTNG
jgi:hypothetical protein